MTPNTRLIAFINAAHGFTHYSLLILPTVVLAMAAPDGRFGAIIRKRRPRRVDMPDGSIDPIESGSEPDTARAVISRRSSDER